MWGWEGPHTVYQVSKLIMFLNTSNMGMDDPYLRNSLNNPKYFYHSFSNNQLIQTYDWQIGRLVMIVPDVYIWQWWAPCNTNIFLPNYDLEHCMDTSLLIITLYINFQKIFSTKLSQKFSIIEAKFQLKILPYAINIFGSIFSNQQQCYRST